ncbi:MAG: hypothetical protein PWP23_1551 [Candidatus Sumerlaeota bacterium]|nr:hypothetical protein [Candidatus Sumerlaeota bacterium]
MALWGYVPMGEILDPGSQPDSPPERLVDLLSRSASLLRSANSLEKSFEEILEAACTCLHADAGVIREVRGKKLQLVAFQGIPEHLVAPLMDAGVGISAKLLAGETVRIVNTEADPVTEVLSRRAKETRDHFHFRSYVGVPLIANGHVVGLFGLYAVGSERSFSENDIKWMHVVADFLAMALANSRLSHELSESSRDFSAYRAERSEVEKRLGSNAMYDSFTGLPLEPLFLEHVERSLARARRQEDYHFTLGVLRLRRFSIVADTLGAHAAEQLIAECLSRLKAPLQPDDVIARLAPDLFGFLLEQPEMKDGKEVIIAQLERDFARPMNIANRSLHTTVHLGIIRDGPVTSSAEILLQKALATEHQSVRETASGVVVYSPVLLYAERRAIEFQADIQRGIEAGEFSLFFQPIVEAATLRPVGAEALLRWHHPERGVLLPGEFLFQAENGGCMTDLSILVVREACSWMQKIISSSRGSRDFFVTVNVSPRQLATSDIARMLIGIIDEYDFPPKSVKMEITETAMIAGSQRIVAALHELDAAGIGLWLDDFGKGYSSLGRLHTLPFECIKIDSAFVSSLGIDENSSKIVSAIASLGNNLGLDVLAEGIESPAHLEALRELGVCYFQGFHLARPMPAGRAARIVLEMTPMPVPN